MILKNRLAELMAEYGRKTGYRLTQDDLSQETKVAQSTISAYVTNKVRRYDARIVETFLEFFGCNVTDFFVLDEGFAEDRLEEENGHRPQRVSQGQNA
ncbi:MAG: helix-turn-helix transcriptional regulator [Chloroflexi bacterium]|nr:helix-turn-helix transcriptional regulator [Chloroflexota bacterium]